MWLFTYNHACFVYILITSLNNENTFRAPLTMKITPLTRGDIILWIDNILSSSSYEISVTGTLKLLCIQMPQPQGGAVIFRGHLLLRTEETKRRINYLQMLAIKQSLKCFVEHLRQKHIVLMVDNMRAVTIPNNMGTEYYKLCEPHNTHVMR